MSNSPLSTSDKTKQEDATQKKKRRGRWPRWAALGLVCVVVLLLLAPWGVAHSPLRDPVLNWAVSSDNLHIESTGAELAWTSPVRLDDVVITSEEDDFRMSVRKIQFEASLIDLWWNSPDLSQVALDQPRVDMALPRLVPAQVPGESTPLTLAADVTGASLRLRAPARNRAVLDADDLDLKFDIASTPEHRLLTVEPVQFLDRYPVTEEACDEGLQLVAPILARVGRVEGTMSLGMDSFRMPLDEVDVERRRNLTDIEGRLQLHEVVAGLRNPVLQEVVANLSSLFGFEMPSEVRVADETVIGFHVRNGRVHHEGLFFLLPQITGEKTWTSRGSVGFDESLDLIIDAPLPVDLLYDNELTRRLSQQQIQLHLGGTIDAPEVQLAGDRAWLFELAEAVIPVGERGLIESDDPIDRFIDQATIVIEGGQAAIDLWETASQWWFEPGSPPSDGAHPAAPPEPSDGD